jgi:hypothetical protein
VVCRHMEQAGLAGQVDLPTRHASHAAEMNIEPFTATTILDSQTIAEKLRKNHEIGKANCTQNWTRTAGARFNTDTLRMVFERKLKHIEDVEERERINKQEFFEFLDECRDVTQRQTPYY